MNLEEIAKGGEAAVYRIKNYDRKEMVAKCTLLDTMCESNTSKEQLKAHKQFLHIIKET